MFLAPVTMPMHIITGAMGFLKQSIVLANLKRNLANRFKEVEMETSVSAVIEFEEDDEDNVDFHTMTILGVEVEIGWELDLALRRKLETDGILAEADDADRGDWEYEKIKDKRMMDAIDSRYQGAMEMRGA
jgi:hypothetical protein